MNLVKLCVGAESIEDLADYQRRRLAAAKAAGTVPELVHHTRQMPKRRGEVETSGSLYWVIKGFISVRQRILALRPEEDGEGHSLCAIVLDHTLVVTRPVPKRPFQGWRYLQPADAPADLAGLAGSDAAIPAKMRAELAELALI